MVLLVLVALARVCPPIALADTGTGVITSIPPVFLEPLVQVVATLLLMLIGVLGTYLTALLAKSKKLHNINAASKEAIDRAKITVGELQQTVVDDLKAAHEDGKLTDEEVQALKLKLIEKAMPKISQDARALLYAASVDVEALISGAGEAWINKLKNDG